MMCWTISAIGREAELLGMVNRGQLISQFGQMMEVDSFPLRALRTVFFLHPFTGLGHWLPVIGNRVIEADHLQDLVVFHRQYGVQFFTQRNEPWILLQFVTHGIFQKQGPSEPVLQS